MLADVRTCDVLLLIQTHFNVPVTEKLLPDSQSEYQLVSERINVLSQRLEIHSLFLQKLCDPNTALEFLEDLMLGFIELY